MAATKEDTNPTTKKFSKGERSIPHHSQKASKYYPADDVVVPKKVRPNMRSQQEDESGSMLYRLHDCRLHTVFLLWQPPYCNPHNGPLTGPLLTATPRSVRRNTLRSPVSPSSPVPSLSSLLVASEASASLSSSTFPRVFSSSLVLSKSTVFPCEG